MSSDLTVASHVEGWVIKTPSDPAPRRIAESDWLEIDRVLHGLSGRTAESALAELSEVLGGWLVQRAKGQRPSFLEEEDYLSLLALLPLPDTANAALSTVEMPDRVIRSDESSSDMPESPQPAAVIVHVVRQPLPRPDCTSANLAMALFHLDHGV
ncbi:hypothetical protein [Asaia sp. HN010]|uniref:hypothetical protein n=1 Tax=Asaia sp. HN010 TaxID=3081233 RepID=UPI003018FA69